MKNFIKEHLRVLNTSLGILFMVFCVFLLCNTFEQTKKVHSNNVEAVEVVNSVTELRSLTTTLITVHTTIATTTTVTTTTEVITTTEEITTEQVEEPVYEYVEPTEEVTESPTEVQAEKEPNNTYGISDEEYRMFVLAVYLESGNQSFECKQAVASVIMNRVNLEAFPNSIYGVLTQRGQFTIDFSRTDTPDSDCYKAVDSVLSGGSVLPIDVKYFFATYCTDSWLWSRPLYTTIGDVVFAY